MDVFLEGMALGSGRRDGGFFLKVFLSELDCLDYLAETGENPRVSGRAVSHSHMILPLPCVLEFWRFGVLRPLVALHFVRFGVLRPTAGVQAAFCAFWTWGHS